VWQWQWQL
jgi:hypothetical protein